MGLEQARFNMIEQQIRPWDVLDQNILDLLSEIPRDLFVNDVHKGLAYADTAIPLGHNQDMMHPKIEARMLQALNVHPTDRALEIGTGSGYVTALLARLAHHVRSVDIYADFTQQAQKRLQALAIDNITLENGDAAQGWAQGSLFDVIAITGSLPAMPEAFKKMMNRGGRLFVITGKPPVMEAVLIRRIGNNDWTQESLFETELAPLVNASTPSTFVF
jgi:protein-L-isoaspartate(D-aspartate) O-methyltransferase